MMIDEAWALRVVGLNDSLLIGWRGGYSSRAYLSFCASRRPPYPIDKYHKYHVTTVMTVINETTVRNHIDLTCPCRPTFSSHITLAQTYTTLPHSGTKA